MENRGAAATTSPATGEYTIWLASQTPHIMRLLMTAFVFGIPETKMRVIAPEVGGGFGTKIDLYAEYGLRRGARGEARPAGQVGRGAARGLRRDDAGPRRRQPDRARREARGQDHGGEVKRSANIGGILSTTRRDVPTTLYGRHASGAYGFRRSTARCRRLHEHGHGRRVPRRRPARGDVRRSSGQSTSSRGSSISTRSRSAGRTSSRRRVPVRQWRDPQGARDTTPATTRRRWTAALELVDYDGVPRRAGGAPRTRGPLARDRLLDLRRDLRAGAVKWIGTVARAGARAVGERQRPRPPDRQGRRHDRHAAARAGARDDVSQIVASSLGVADEDVTVQHGDTSVTPFGYGTYGSRSARRRRDRALQQPQTR